MVETLALSTLSTVIYLAIGFFGIALYDRVTGYDAGENCETRVVAHTFLWPLLGLMMASDLLARLPLLGLYRRIVRRK